MNLTGLHILLTYKCIYECDHCFVWGSPRQSGVFTLAQLEDLYQQALALGTVDEIYFEGGETFIYYPVLVRALARAHQLGFTTGIVTNGYWANNVEDAEAWLRPLQDAGLDQIEISCDAFHDEAQALIEHHPGMEAARRLGLPTSLITLEPPQRERDPATAVPGTPVAGGGVMFRGRAAETLAEGLPRQPWRTLSTCPYENLVAPDRVHVDPFGNVHLCQGLVMGNLFERPFTQIVAEYEPETHPIVRELLCGGPAQLVSEYALSHEAGYVDACHLCYTARQELRSRFPKVLAPDQMYGVF